jgi:hypothetical protein
MDDGMDEFEELHVVSDLHLGGDPGHQIFKGTDLLSGHLNSLCGLPSDLREKVTCHAESPFLAREDRFKLIEEISQAAGAPFNGQA